MQGTIADRLTERWRLLVILFWIAVAALMIFERWNNIRWFALGDTDDNLRMAQVRALIAGQDWFDLRQYKLNPPFGADIHWSRLVDLPIAGIKLALSPLLGGALAEKIAVTLAPLLPMLATMFAIAVTMRRLIGPKAFALGIAILLCAPSLRGMWAPLRIDHHGWQLAMLALALVGLVDRRPARGGLLLGVATALSLSIGLEMLLYLALAGAIVGLTWVHDRDQAPRLAAYGASLAGGVALGFLLFASNANRLAVCDALSPVWLSVMATAGAFGVMLAWYTPASRWHRFAAAAVAALLLGAGYAYFWPHCLGRLEGASDAAHTLWLSHVREARPIYMHGRDTIVSISALPVTGLIGYALMLWRARRDEAQWKPWAAAAALALLAASLLFWQTRAGPAAQLLAVPGAAGLAWIVIGWFQAKTNLLARVAGTVTAFFIISGLAPMFVEANIPADGKSAGRNLVDEANRKCPTMTALRPIALQTPGTVLTHVDLGPRLIAVTPHKAIAGPYHRNDKDIVAVMRAFRGSENNAHRTVVERDIDYVLICPNLSESTIYRARAPDGFYVQLTKSEVPSWLERVKLPDNSPYMMWRVKR